MNYLLTYQDNSGIQNYSSSLDGIVSFIIDHFFESNFAVISLSELKPIEGKAFSDLLKPIFTNWENNTTQVITDLKNELITKATDDATIKTTSMKDKVERDINTIKAVLGINGDSQIGSGKE